jgi:hypothetical protein
MTVAPGDWMSWRSKCAYNHCGRALGVALDRSPFPVAPPSCEAFSMCVNEYGGSAAELQALHDLSVARGCAPL